MDIITAKKDLRAVLAARRNEIAPAIRQAAAARIAEVGAQVFSAHGSRVISVFHSFSGEVGTGPLMKALARQAHTLCLPVIVARNEPLIFRRWAPGERLISGQFRIFVPGEGAPVVEPDILLVPLLGFNRRGHRIGYGGGYYDRTLASLRRKRSILAVGLAFAEQEVDDVPHADYDERLDAVLTQEGYRPFQAGNG